MSRLVQDDEQDDAGDRDYPRHVGESLAGRPEAEPKALGSATSNASAPMGQARKPRAVSRAVRSAAKRISNSESGRESNDSSVASITSAMRVKAIRPERKA